jgi:hypothetical protein
MYDPKTKDHYIYQTRQNQHSKQDKSHRKI